MQSVAPPPPIEPAADGMVPVVHTIVYGDTFWDILEGYYGEGHVDGALINRVAGDNGIADPSNIPIGTPVTIAWEPAPITEPAAPPPTPPAPTPTTEPAVTSDASPAAAPETTAATPTPVTVPPTPIVADPDRVDPPAPAVAAPVEDTDADDDATLFDWSSRSLWWTIPTGTLLAAGVMLMTRRLRSRRLSRLDPGEQLAAPPAVAAGTECALTAGDPEQRLSTLKSLLRTVTPYAREQADPPPVRAVQLAEDRIEILFAAPAGFPPQGWTTVDGGISWVHRFGDATAPTVQQLVTPALVTLGLRPEGGDLLLDLETAGSLAITGDRTVAQGMARSMALELATCPLGVAMDLCLIGFDVDGVEACDRTWRDTTLPRAVRVGA